MPYEYLSPATQNEIIELMDKNIKEYNILCIRHNGVYLVSANEGISINNKAILTMTHRSVTNYLKVYEVLSRVYTIPNLKAEIIA